MRDIGRKKAMRTIKCVVVGDGAVGKTSLVNSYVKKEFPNQQVPTAFESHAINITVDGRPIRLSLWDTAGQDDYDKLRPLAYPQADVVIICFSVMNPASFGNVKSKWLPELLTNCSDAPLILCGTKSDLRINQEALQKLQERSLRPVTCPQGIAMSRDIDAVKYVQCSALAHLGVENVFEEAVRVVLNPACVEHQQRNCRECRHIKIPKNKHCSIL